MQHRAYQPLLPAGNKYLQQKWDNASYDLHRKKVMSAKPTIKTTPPQTYSHLALKMRKQKLEEEWTMKIERENKMLMEKITHIMRTTGGIDNQNCYESKSLGKEKRQLELLRITKENQMILLRLNKCRPHYNVRCWDEDWLKTVKVMDSISRYPQGRANQPKEREKREQKGNCCDQEQKMISDAATHSSASNEINSKDNFDENEKRGEASKTEDTESKIQQDKNTKQPEKSTSPDSPENCGSSDTLEITTDKHSPSVETSLHPDGSETSNTPHTPKTYKSETPRTEEE